MSLLFAYIGNWVKQAGPSKNFYKLIIALNRDDHFNKPTIPITTWSSPDSHILACQEPQKQNGTWFGVSTHGKLGVVLKIKRDLTRIATEDHQRRAALKEGKTLVSRAALVPNYLRSDSSWDFCSKLCEGPETRCAVRQFFPFQMFAVDILPPNSNTGSVKATYLTNLSSPDINHKEKPVDITPPVDTCEFFGYGNTPIYKPFKKVYCGRQEFIDIIATCSSDDSSGAVIANQENKVSLRNNLLEFLRSTRRYLPDPVLQEYARTSRVKEKIAYGISSRFVYDYFDINTRSQFILMVDTNNNATLYEWHLDQPIFSKKTSKWVEAVHEFTVGK